MHAEACANLNKEQNVNISGNKLNSDVFFCNFVHERQRHRLLNSKSHQLLRRI